MQSKTLILSLLIVSLVSVSAAWADIPILIQDSASVASETKTSDPASHSAQISSTDVIKLQAKRWGLSPDDYAHYLDLMKNTPSGQWYKNSDPAEVLAINAHNEAEREKYAEIVAKNTHDRLENELAMQRAFNIVWQKLYPDLKPIQLPSQRQEQKQIALQAGDQLLLFTSILNSNNHFMLPPLITAIEQHAGTKLAIFMVGNSVSDNDIQAWAKDNQIPLRLVEQGNIVLDHDKGRFIQMTNGTQSLPTLILNHQGKFNSVSVNEING